MIILFVALWAAFFAGVLLLIAAVPTTVQTPNSALIWPLVITGVLAALITLVVAGAISLFS